MICPELITEEEGKVILTGLTKRGPRAVAAGCAGCFLSVQEEAQPQQQQQLQREGRRRRRLLLRVYPRGTPAVPPRQRMTPAGLGRARASAGPEMVPQISLMHPSSCRTERKHPAHPAALHRVQGSSALSLGTLSTSCGRAARLSQAENTSPRPEPHRAGMLCGDMLHTESFTQLPPALAGSGPLPERLAPSSPVGRVNASPGFHEEPLTPGTPPTAEQPTSTKHAHINEADAEPHGIHRLLSTGTECAREVGDQSAQLACILNEVRRANAGVEELRREVQECRAEMQEVRVLCEVQARAHTSAMATRFSVQSRESNASQGHLSPSHVPRVFGMQRNPLQPAQGGLSRFTSFRFR
eukprot:TRINITY_DN314_c0_g1_i2.p1 TRINITY_DN314_c0_g1~~TRINITY_DN314_c0_g1_i2.p1  ORF type:complete len:355 (+),score=28.43 TRINITY_DN314_c0_g1_i2:111-1175(+)